MNKNQITKEILNDLYWKKGLSISQITKMFKMKSCGGITYHMDKFGISRRPSCRKNYIRFKFSGNLNEKAYMIGLRTGDIHARKDGQLVQVETTSTKQAQILMFKKTFGKYAKVRIYEKRGGYTEKTNRIYCHLDPSFKFLIEKPKSIPDWIMKNDKFFYSFLTGYCDSEASWIITQHKKYRDLIFSLGTCDKTILKQIYEKLKELGFNAHFYLVRKKGIYDIRKSNLDLYRVMIMRQKDVVRLAKILLSLSMHEDKRKAKLHIINYNKLNLKRKELKRKKLGTIKLTCIKCGHKKVWKNGSKRYKNIKYPRFKCPICKMEFERKRYNAFNRSFLS